MAAHLAFQNPSAFAHGPPGRLAQALGTFKAICATLKPLTLSLSNILKPKAGSLLALPALVVCFYFSASSCGFSRLGPPEVTVTIAGLRTFVPIL